MVVLQKGNTIKIVSIDIETTGLDPNLDQILEIGAVCFELTPDWKMSETHCFSQVIKHDRIQGHPYALAMNADIIKESLESGVSLNTAIYNLKHWITIQNGIDGSKPITFAGKNFTGFGKRFLEPVLTDKNYFRIHYRAFEVENLYFNPRTDEVIPDIQTCIDRAMLPRRVSHSALDDAIVVAKLIRKFYLWVE